ncbi:aldo/keto reductase [Anaerovibrio slackiae]|uniref:aldo/keto reductase n=1 Tax=Anaerovibrio slackiae TaxID=2652309 RepID=UPI0038640A8B
MEYMELSNGINLPAVGFGPGICGYSAKYVRRRSGLLSIPGRAYNRLVKRPFIEKDYVEGIASAIRSGYRLIDYSAAYGDGSLVAKGIEASGVSRDELILTTRVSNRAQFAGADRVKDEFLEQLKNMKTDYVDIFMFHWPVTDCYENTWKVMVELYKQGYVKTLGVANCHEHHLEVLFNLTEERPLINQFEIHPLFTQKKLIRYCLDNGIRPEAYTPTARFDDRLVRLPLLHRIGKKYGKSILQVVLRWHVQNGVIPVVRALTKSHQQENIDIFDFSLSEAEMADIDGININARVRYDPDNCDFSIL